MLQKRTLKTLNKPKGKRVKTSLNQGRKFKKGPELIHGNLHFKQIPTVIEAFKPPLKSTLNQIKRLSKTIPTSAEIYDMVKSGQIENKEHTVIRKGIKPDKVLTKFTQKEWHNLHLGQTFNENGKTYYCVCLLSVIEPTTKARYPMAYFVNIDRIERQQ